MSDQYIHFYYSPVLLYVCNPEILTMWITEHTVLQHIEAFYSEL